MYTIIETNTYKTDYKKLKKTSANNSILEDIKRVIYEEVRKCEEGHITDWSTIKSNLKDTLRDYIFEKTKRNPMILPIITEV